MSGRPRFTTTCYVLHSYQPDPQRPPMAPRLTSAPVPVRSGDTSCTYDPPGSICTYCNEVVDWCTLFRKTLERRPEPEGLQRCAECLAAEQAAKEATP